MSLTQEAEVHALDFSNQQSLKALLMHFLSITMTMEESVGSVSTGLNQKHSLEIILQGVRGAFPSDWNIIISQVVFAVNLIENEHYAIIW